MTSGRLADILIESKYVFKKLFIDLKEQYKTDKSHLHGLDIDIFYWINQWCDEQLNVKRKPHFEVTCDLLVVSTFMKIERVSGPEN